MNKQVYDLTPDDIAANAVWVFPMDDSVEDEASVRPVACGEIIPDGLQRIVRAVFRDAAGRQMPGYIYAGCGTHVEDTRPVAWCGDVCVTFWNGINAPSAGFLDRLSGSGIRWPVTYETCLHGMPLEKGTLDGIYYWTEGSVRCVTNSI